MVKKNHVLVEKEDNTLSFVRVDYDDYLYEEDAQDGSNVEEEHDISFGVEDQFAVKSDVENNRSRKYKVRLESRGSRYEGLDDLVRVMIRTSADVGDSILDSHPSRILRQVFTNHLVLRWGEEQELLGRGYQGAETLEAPYEYSFAGIRVMRNEGSSGSSGDIAVRAHNIKRDGRIQRYRIRDVITNVWDSGQLCSWTRDTSRFTEGRHENMYTPRAIYRYYDTMTQGISNRDLAGANRTDIRKAHLLIILEDYKENYLEKLTDSERKNVAIRFVEEKINGLRNSNGGSGEVSTAELVTISNYSERYYLEFAN